MRAAATLARFSPQTRANRTAVIGYAPAATSGLLPFERRTFSTDPGGEIAPPKFCPPSFQPADERLGLCIVGAGRMGTIRTQGIMANPGTFLCSIVDPDRARAKELSTACAVPAYWYVTELGSATTHHSTAPSCRQLVPPSGLQTAQQPDRIAGSSIVQQ